VISALAGLGATIYKFAFDLRLLQSPPIGELSEPFGQKQVGSSAMPFKRNPIQSEKINSLARALAQMPQVAWHNAAHSLLERTSTTAPTGARCCPRLSSSSMKSCGQPLAHYRKPECECRCHAAQHGCVRPLRKHRTVADGLVQAGADRQEMHEVLRQHALTAWQSLQSGAAQPPS
jgi:adenylosuccinate lyase